MLRSLRLSGAAVLALWFGLVLARPAVADIVWQGRVVSAWPDEAPATPRGVARAVAETRFFPQPKGTIEALTLQTPDARKTLQVVNKKNVTIK